MPIWTEVFSGNDDFHAFCEYDGLLWAICSNVNPRSGKRGTIYNSATGGLGDWADEGSWAGPCDLYANSYEGESSSRFSHLFVHDGYLHLVCNHHYTDAGATNTHGHFYRRELDGTWSLLFEEVDQLSPGYRYVSAESDGEDITLAGLVYIFPGTPTLRAVIWRVDGTTYARTVEYQAALLGQSDVAWRCFYSEQDGEWYACTDSTVRSRDGGMWPAIYETGDALAFAHGGYFYQPDAQTLWCGDWRRLGGVWEDMAQPDGPTINGIEERAEGLLFVTAASGDLSAYYTPGGWFDYGGPGGLRLNSLALFNDAWFIAGANLASRGRIWRIDPDYAVNAPDPDGGGPGAGAGTCGAAMDCDADGDMLYLGLYDGAGQPMLIRVPLPLTADSLGVALFEPGAGDSIDIKATNIGGRLAVCGRFSAGGNDSVQVSVDGGVAFIDIADAWGDTARPMAVDDLDHVLTTLQTAQDITRTEDGGLNWQVTNPAIGYSPTALAQLKGTDELILAGPSIDYSPNAGEQLHDTAFPPGDAVALEVL